MSPPRFAPMLATTPRQLAAEQLLCDDAWALDIKADGDRCAVLLGDGKITTLGRDAQRLSRPLPHAVRQQLLATLPDGHYVLDGEVVDGRLYLFDVPTINDLIGPWHPWQVRRAALDTLLAAFGPAGAVRGIPYAIGYDDKLALIDTVVSGRGEGLVAKRIDSAYREGARSRDWVKVKRHHEVDCVVTWIGVEKANMGVGVYDGDNLVDVAEVGRLTGDGARCTQGSVVTVRCLYASAADRLVQPTLPRLRTDKAPRDCTLDQLDAARTNQLLLEELTAGGLT